MPVRTQYLTASQAASKLGVSTKALRVYEQHGLLEPLRTAAGWRAYSPDQMARAATIVRLRAMGFSLAQASGFLTGSGQVWGSALAEHQQRLETNLRNLADMIRRVRMLRGDRAPGKQPGIGEHVAAADPIAAFDLPWPWNGERFELRELPPITYITGPLGSGKTRFARLLGETLPGATFLGAERLADGAASAWATLAADTALGERVEYAMAGLIAESALRSNALVALLASVEADQTGALVIDMVEQGLNDATQKALIARFRLRKAGCRPLVLLTRSCLILDMGVAGGGEAVIYCPANHSVPIQVEPFPGGVGYEAVSTCLAPPDVRARTEGVVAWRRSG